MKKNGNRYPWAEWFGRGEFVITRSEHFPAVTVNSMRVMIRRQANILRVGVETSVRRGEIRVRVTEKRGYKRRAKRKRK